MKTRSLFHVGLCVSDIDRSLRFYSEVVGLRAGAPMTYRAPLPNDAADGATRLENVRTLLDNTEMSVRTAYLTNDEWTLQLIEYSNGGGEPLDLAHNRPGCAHFCIYVNDADAKRAELVSRDDVTITSEVIQLGPQMRSFYTSDPDGLPVEFLQLTGGVDHETVLAERGLPRSD